MFSLSFLSALLTLALLAAGPVATARPPASSERSGVAPEPQLVELRGRVVCLAEEMSKLYQTDLPTNHEHLFGFKTKEGKFYTLLRTKTSEALFADERLHKKELILRGRTFPNSQVLDVIGMRSVRDGVVCDLFYYCDICSIVTIVPGPCMCCRDPVELVERPINGPGGSQQDKP